MASAVTSIYEYPISAASAAYAPTNTAEVTAMIDSAVSGKLDSSASSAFQPSGNYQTAGDYVSSSELANYQTTAGMSAYATTAALADKLDASASSSFQPAGDYQTAGDYVSSSELADFQTTAGMSAYQTVDGMSAYQSAGDYATTADLSAKLDASAEVVTAIGTTELPGVTTFVTSINGNPVSSDISDRANKDMNGRDLTSLAASSSLADYQTTAGMSGYATTGDLSAKLDASASSAFVTSTAGLVSTGDLENYQTTAGMSGYATTGDLSAKLDASASSAFITSTAGLVSTGDLENYQTTAGMSGYATTGDLSAYLETSAIETSTAGVTGIAGTAIACDGGASIPFIGYYWDSAASATAEITADVSSVSSLPYEKYDGTKVNAYKGITDSLGIEHLGVASFIEPGAQINNKLSHYTLAFAPASSMWTTAGVATGIYAPLQYGTGAGMFIDNNAFKGFLKGNEIFICNTSIGRAVRIEAHQSRNARVGLTGDSSGKTTANFTPSEISFCSAGYATSTYGRTKIGFSSTASGTAAYGINYITLYDSDASSQKTISSTSIDYWNGKLDGSSIETSTAGVTGIGGTAIAGGGGGGGSADWSAESGQPGYIENKPVPKTLVAGAGITITENSAQLVVASTNTLYSAGNGLTLNGTTFSVDTGVVVTTGALTDYQTTADMSAYATTADMSAYATTESLSGYVPGTSPIIGTETFAGYWAGSAVYQKIVSGVVTSNASGTAADSDPDYAGKTAWIDPSNSFMIYGSTANILPVNWYLGSARNGGFSLVGTARPIIYRGVDNAATTCTAYVCVKYIK